MDAAGGNVKEITARYNGKPKSPNDLVFDERGNVYITDVSGTPVDPAGGVYRLSANLSEVHPIMQNLVTANGISLAPPGTAIPSPFVVPYELWVAESALNRLLHLKLQADGITPGHPPAVVAYYFTGDFGPDSNAVDAEGNVYQSLVGQGRFLVLSKTGIPVAQILVPGRDEGKSLLTTNAAFKPGTDQGFITAGGPDGGWVYTFHGLGRALKLFSHQ
jgi:lactonase